MCLSDTLLLHQKNVRFFCVYSSETGMHETSRNMVKSPEMLQMLHIWCVQWPNHSPCCKERQQIFKPSFQLGLQGNFSAKVISAKHNRITCATWLWVHLLGVMIPQQRVSDALGDREIQQYHHRNLFVYWCNSSVRSQCEGQLARSLWGIARVMIETRVPQDKDQKGWL